jgi:hypothetical protein
MQNLHQGPDCYYPKLGSFILAAEGVVSRAYKEYLDDESSVFRHCTAIRRIV